MFKKLLGILFFHLISCDYLSRIPYEDHLLKIEFRQLLLGEEKYIVLDKDVVSVNLRSTRWRGEIPYELVNVTNEDTVKSAMDIYQQYTCLSFRPKTDDDIEYLFISGNTRACVTAHKNDSVVVGLGPGCLHGVGTALHEFMHALGFQHEHIRPDRDEYILIHPENIINGLETQFEKLTEYDTFGLPYDFDSVLHYATWAFQSKDMPTIEPKENYTKFTNRMGQRHGFSKGDIIKINVKYSCPEKNEELNLSDDYLYAKTPTPILDDNIN